MWAAGIGLAIFLPIAYLLARPVASRVVVMHTRFKIAGLAIVGSALPIAMAGVYLTGTSREEAATTILTVGIGLAIFLPIAYHFRPGWGARETARRERQRLEAERQRLGAERRERREREYAEWGKRRIARIKADSRAKIERAERRHRREMALALVRDRDNERCHYCGSENGRHLTYLVPLTHGGEDDADNLVLACRSCDQRQRSKIGDIRRVDIYDRDDGRCAYCRVRLAREGNWHVDHVFPRSRGGGDGAENLVLTCANCNLSKGDRTLDEWARTASEPLAPPPRGPDRHRG